VIPSTACQTLKTDCWYYDKSIAACYGAMQGALFEFNTWPENSKRNYEILTACDEIQNGYIKTQDQNFTFSPRLIGG
jgi:hypothetical protein